MFLLCHPDTPNVAVHTLQADAEWMKQGPRFRLTLSYRLIGDLNGLSIPPLSASTSTERTEGLWEHCCFEAFVTRTGETSYREFNFSPSGQWAAYAFSNYRQREPTLDPQAMPEIKVQRLADGLLLEALVDDEALATTAQTAAGSASGVGSFQLGLSAVVEANDGRRSYWALRHAVGKPTPKPDFHNRETFILALTAPTKSG